MENRFLRLIEVLTRHQVRFVVVGGVAAVLQRVPVATQDFDIVHDRSEDNVQRLLAALAELGAVYRGDPRNLRPGETHLRGPGNQLLQAGNLMFDVLGAIDWAGGYDDLLPHSELLEVGDHSVRVLTLEKLIDVKRHLSRPKDKLMLMHLEAALEEREKGRG
ncbi:MAG: hypothetical protein IT375_02055 [Polyangiaceae bacterium]|nr:hypothetical protein [Polyangiaceae bacterium]